MHNTYNSRRKTPLTGRVRLALATKSPSLRRRALEALADFDLPIPEDTTEYKGSQWGWVCWLLTHKTPETDERLAQKVDGESQVEAKHCRPDKEPLSCCSGESTSWSFIQSQWLKKNWLVYNKRIIEILLSSDKKEKVLSELNKLKKEILSTFDREFEELIDNLNSLVPEKAINSSTVMVSGSGADAIVSFKKFLFPDGVKAVTTGENGSGVIKGFDLNSETMIRLRDPKTDRPYSNEEVFNQYKAKIKAGARVVSLTVMSKTGLNYNEPGGVTEQVLDYVEERNKKYPQNQVLVVLDCVQVAGRAESKEIFRWFNHSAVGALVFTGSKAFGRIPHVGFTFLTAKGVTCLQDALQKISLDRAQQIIDQHQVIKVPFMEKVLAAVNTKKDIITVVRAIDNARGIKQGLSLPAEKRLYGQRAENFAKLYQDFFRSLGFEVLDDGVTSIISIHPPQDIPVENVGKVLLVELAKRGISLGGILQEGQRPILRWGLQQGLLQSDMTERQLKKQLNSVLEKSFSQAIEKAAAA